MADNKYSIERRFQIARILLKAENKLMSATIPACTSDDRDTQLSMEIHEIRDELRRIADDLMKDVYRSEPVLNDQYGRIRVPDKTALHYLATYMQQDVHDDDRFKNQTTDEIVGWFFGLIEEAIGAYNDGVRP